MHGVFVSLRVQFVVLLLAGHEVVDGERVVEGVRVVLRFQVRAVHEHGMMLVLVLMLRDVMYVMLMLVVMMVLMVILMVSLVFFAVNFFQIRSFCVFVRGRVSGSFRLVREFHLGLFVFQLVALEAFLPAQVASVLEHVARIWVECPERTFPRFVRRSGHFEKAVVEGE